MCSGVVMQQRHLPSMPDRLEQQRGTAESDARERLVVDGRTAALAGAPFVPVTGGLSNFAWRAADAAGEWCVRLARVGTESLGADPASECRILLLVAAAGLAPPVLRCDPDARLLVTRWIAGACPPGGAARGAHYGRLARVLAGLHALPVREDIRAVDFAAQGAALEHTVLEDPERRLRTTAATVFRDLEREPGPSVLCHNDLNAQNMIEDGSGRIWLVDWEYSGCGEAVFDLASCASQHQMSHAQARRFVQLYRAAGGTCADERFQWARWGFDYVQWLWYRAFRSHGDAAERQLADERAARLARTLLERASSLPHCNN
jgi:aminoglycoside phosphotransferase (APT) family kinase protein